jgi:orotidine-5'-phosphate decarboxylase
VNSRIPAQDRLIAALDVRDVAQAKALVRRLGDAVRIYKIGLELFMSADFFELLAWLIGEGRQVFVDLKFFDIPETVARAVSALAERGAAFCTVHGNQAMMEAAVSARANGLKVLAVTVLTSLDRGDLDDLGFACDVEQLVRSRARRAQQAGCDGVVSSGREAAQLRADGLDRLLIVTPGIRPVDNREESDQKRVVTPTAAIAAGADYLVVGRPIRDASDPRAAALRIQDEIAHAVGE